MSMLSAGHRGRQSDRHGGRFFEWQGDSSFSFTSLPTLTRVRRMKSKVRLGVNIDHVATLRQVRGGTTPYPNILKMMRLAVQGGADQITIHLREDRRHIQEEDVKLIARHRMVPLNLEMAATKEMQQMALKYKPDWVCLVPEKREELTTEGGLDVHGMLSRLTPIVDALRRHDINVSMFIEPSDIQVKASRTLGADAVEFHTGKWVGLSGRAQDAEFKKLVSAAKLTHKYGMNVHAGHGLDYDSLKAALKIPYLEEVNIGHSIVCHALELGLKASVKKMKACLK